MFPAARGFFGQAWWMSTFPGIAIMLVVIAHNLFGDGLRDILDPPARDRPRPTPRPLPDQPTSGHGARLYSSRDPGRTSMRRGP